MTLRYLVNCSILLTDLPVLERPAAAKAAGFDAVEFWWPFPEPVPADRDVDAFEQAVRDAGVALVGLNFFAGDMPGGDRGVVSWPGRATEFRDNVDVAVGLGERLGVHVFNALYGNRLDNADPLRQDELATENLLVAAEAAERIGATVLVEPVSGGGRYPLRTADDAGAVLDDLACAGAGNVGLLADLYHLASNGDDVERAIARYRDRIAHVQIADTPGRGEPGTGHLPLARWLEDLDRGGYQGFVGLEYKATAEDPFAWLPRAERGSGALTDHS
ncbi:TIM barrel protein [Pseudonocardia sp. C8]|uniref:hydroxypyruvate isomerase family protein n=1 Tax=Pseudonocardia sp. C8 TaxID=2762759 RepID=UPI001643017E|nr:TIM barrel protein [Pseudonocardia sp. C8]MBC3189545.1 TIM barrel protein [Pseudonocardia sp. C8]